MFNEYFYIPIKNHPDNISININRNFLSFLRSNNFIERLFECVFEVV